MQCTFLDATDGVETFLYTLFVFLLIPARLCGWRGYACVGLHHAANSPSYYFFR